jgi:hypothetical protein
MAVTAASVAMTTTAAALNVAGNAQTLYLQNTGANAVTVGPAGVVAAQGWVIPATTGTLTITVGVGEVLYGLTASATSTVLVTRTGA